MTICSFISESLSGAFLPFATSIPDQEYFVPVHASSVAGRFWVQGTQLLIVAHCSAPFPCCVLCGLWLSCSFCAQKICYLICTWVMQTEADRHGDSLCDHENAAMSGSWAYMDTQSLDLWLSFGSCREEQKRKGGDCLHFFLSKAKADTAFHVIMGVFWVWACLLLFIQRRLLLGQ